MVPVGWTPRDCVQALLSSLPSCPGPSWDLSITCREGPVIRAHRLVLAAASPSLAAALLSLPYQDDCAVLLLPDFSHQHLSGFLAALYQGLTLQPFSDLLSVLQVTCSMPSVPSLLDAPSLPSVLNVPSVPREPNARIDSVPSPSIHEGPVDDVNGNPDVPDEARMAVPEVPKASKAQARRPGQLGRQKRKRSAVWQHFTKAQDCKDSESPLCTCVHCGKSIASHGGSTSAMTGHLRRHHGELLAAREGQAELVVEKIGGQPEGVEKKRSLVWSHFDKDCPEFGEHRCRHCGESVRSEGDNTSELNLHMVGRHNELVEGEGSSCTLCGESVSGVDGKQRHMQEQHKEAWGREGRELRARVREEASRQGREQHFTQGEIEPNMVCSLCGTVVSRGDVREHLSAEHSSVEPGLVLEGEAGLEVLLGEGEVSLEERQVLERLGARVGVLPCPAPTYLAQGKVCGDCGKEFSTRGGMRFHWRAVHSGLRPFQCGECGASFTRKDSFDSHLVMHANGKPYMCCECGKTFGRRHARNLHERAHRGDKRFNCSFCGKSFLSGHQKRSHERTHTGERPYQCSTCGRQFAQKHQMITHTRVHTGEKPYQCTKCLQWFKHLSSRRNHRCEGQTAGLEAETDKMCVTLAVL